MPEMDKAERAVYMREWRRTHIDSARASGRRSYEKHHAARRAAQREQYLRLKAEAPEKWRRFYGTSKYCRETKFAMESNSRARRFGAIGKLDTATVRAISGPCHYCGATEGVGWDHVMPLSKRGSNTPDNLVPACLPCNQTKAARVIA